MLSLSRCLDPLKPSECPALPPPPFPSLLSPSPFPPSPAAVQLLLRRNVAHGHCLEQGGNVKDCSMLHSFSFRYDWDPSPSERLSDFSSGFIIKNVINLARSETPICIPLKCRPERLEAFPCAHFARESLSSADDRSCGSVGFCWLSVGFPPPFSPPRNPSAIVRTAGLLCRCLD